MNVGFEGGGDPEAVLPGGRNVDVHVAPRVDDDRLAGPIAGDEIGRLREPFVEEALKHRIESLRPCRRSENNLSDPT